MHSLRDRTTVDRNRCQRRCSDLERLVIDNSMKQERTGRTTSVSVHIKLFGHMTSVALLVVDGRRTGRRQSFDTCALVHARTHQQTTPTPSTALRIGSEGSLTTSIVVPTSVDERIYFAQLHQVARRLRAALRRIRSSTVLPPGVWLSIGESWPPRLAVSAHRGEASARVSANLGGLLGKGYEVEDHVAARMIQRVLSAIGA